MEISEDAPATIYLSLIYLQNLQKEKLSPGRSQVIRLNQFIQIKIKIKIKIIQMLYLVKQLFITVYSRFAHII